MFVHENDVYVKEQWDDDASVGAVTSDGRQDTVYNGIPDWVYEEEILGTHRALYSSPAGSNLAFARFDDLQVEEFYYTLYGDPNDPVGSQVSLGIGVSFFNIQL